MFLSTHSRKINFEIVLTETFQRAIMFSRKQFKATPMWLTTHKEVMTLRVIILILSGFLLWGVLKWISYYASTLGLIYYLADKHDDMLGAEKIRKLRDNALERRIKELTGRNTRR